jgi:hypothetical protein
MKSVQNIVFKNEALYVYLPIQNSTSNRLWTLEIRMEEGKGRRFPI